MHLHKAAGTSDFLEKHSSEVYQVYLFLLDLQCPKIWQTNKELKEAAADRIIMVVVTEALLHSQIPAGGVPDPTLKVSHNLSALKTRY